MDTRSVYFSSWTENLDDRKGLTDRRQNRTCLVLFHLIRIVCDHHRRFVAPPLFESREGEDEDDGVDDPRLGERRCFFASTELDTCGYGV